MKKCKNCGKEFIPRGNKKHCSKECSSTNHYNNWMLDYKWRLSKLLAMAKNRSTNKGLPFNLDLDYLIDLWESNFASCQITGIPFELGRYERGKVHPYAPSFDRIDPQKGYVKGNVRIVCYQINVAMSEFGLEQFDRFVKLYTQNGVKF